MIKVCFFGPESTGKSFMAARMAEKYHSEFVPEVARELISSNDFTLEDIERIAEAHHKRVVEKSKTANRILFCDTDAITTEIYSRHYLGAVPDIVFDYQRIDTYEHYFLFDIDVPWVTDGLRDLGDRREEMFALFRDALVTRNISFTLVSGSWMEREAIIEQRVRQLLEQ